MRGSRAKNNKNVMVLNVLLVVVMALAHLGMAGRPSIEEGGRIQVVASIPDLEDLTSRIGGDLVAVESLARGVEDPHGVPMKPSFLPKLNQADVLVLMGLQHEHAWLTGLVEAARNPAILPGGKGYIDCALYIEPKQVPTVLSRKEGDLHPLGNPHFNLDPVLAKRMARAIAEGLARIYPPGKRVFEKNLHAFEASIDQALEKWRRMAEPLQGVKFVSFHQDTIYFAERFGLVEVGQIEIRPGIPPTQSHLVSLVEKMREEDVPLILREPHYGKKLPTWVAEQTGATVAKFLIMVGGNPGVDTYEDLIEFNLQSILDAMRSRLAPGGE